MFEYEAQATERSFIISLFLLCLKGALKRTESLSGKSFLKYFSPNLFINWYNRRTGSRMLPGY